MYPNRQFLGFKRGMTWLNAVLLKPPMKRVPTDATVPVPASLLSAFAPLHTSPSFRTFTGLARELPGREIRVTADSAYAGQELKHLPPPRDLDNQTARQRRLCSLPPWPTSLSGPACLRACARARRRRTRPAGPWRLSGLQARWVLNFYYDY